MALWAWTELLIKLIITERVGLLCAILVHVTCCFISVVLGLTLQLRGVLKSCDAVCHTNVNKDLTFKDKDKDQTLKAKDKDQTYKDKDQDKD